MKNRHVFLAILLFAALGAVAQPLTIEKNEYSLAYAEGWVTNPFLPANDSMSIVMKQFGQGEQDVALSITHGRNGVTENTAQMVSAALTQAYSEGFVRMDSSTQDLGGKTFHTTTWQDTGAVADTSSRLKVYVFQQGSFLFVSFLVYQTPAGDVAVTEVEAALATLQLKATGIRRLAGNRKADRPGVRVDLLGRAWQPFSRRLPRGVYFLKR